jgi:hypothetical protein
MLGLLRLLALTKGVKEVVQILANKPAFTVQPDPVCGKWSTPGIRESNVRWSSVDLIYINRTAKTSSSEVWVGICRSPVDLDQSDVVSNRGQKPLNIRVFACDRI